LIGFCESSRLVFGTNTPKSLALVGCHGNQV